MVEKEKFSYRKYFREIEVLHSLQTAPQERDWLLSVPKEEVKPAEVVLYLGCNVMRNAHLVRTAVDVFKLLDVDFVTVGGGSYCCGIQHFQNGDTKSANAMASSTVKNFQRFQPEQVVMWCPSCIYFYDEVMEMREDFSFQHVTQFLVENLYKLSFRQQAEQKVALHYHTGRPQSDEEARCADFIQASGGTVVAKAQTDPDSLLARAWKAAARDVSGERTRKPWRVPPSDNAAKRRPIARALPRPKPEGITSPAYCGSLRTPITSGFGRMRQARPILFSPPWAIALPVTLSGLGRSSDTRWRSAGGTANQ